VTFNFLLYFRLSTSRFLLRTASFHAGCLHPKRGISVCAIDSRFSLARTEDAEGAEVIVILTSDFTLSTSSYGISQRVFLVMVPSGQVVLFHTTPARLAPVRLAPARFAPERSA